MCSLSFCWAVFRQPGDLALAFWLVYPVLFTDCIAAIRVGLVVCFKDLNETNSNLFEMWTTIPSLKKTVFWGQGLGGGNREGTGPARNNGGAYS